MGAEISKVVADRNLLMMSGSCLVLEAMMPTLSQAGLHNVMLMEASTMFAVQSYSFGISTPTMRECLERKDLIAVQSKLFPKYAFFLTMAGVAQVWAFKCANPDACWFQDWVPLTLIGNVLANLTNWAYLFPVQINALEHELDSNDEDVKKKHHGTFRKFHGLSMIVNFLSMGFNAAYIFNRIFGV